jgi:hypothetical protein
MAAHIDRMVAKIMAGGGDIAFCGLQTTVLSIFSKFKL